MDKRSIHETNSLFWDTKGNDVLGATALPLYGGRIYRRIKLKKQNNFCHPQMCCCRRGETCFSISDRKLSTYVNTLAKAGFAIEQIIEESDDELMQLQNDDFATKAKMLPVTFVIKARKL